MISALNTTIVATALPRIAADLNGLDHYPWVFTAQMVTATATLPIFGKLSDTYGRKRFFLGGIVVMILGSAIAGTAQDMLQLSLYRAIQGIGAGAMTANSMAIVSELFPPRELAKWRALNQGVFMITNTVGPLVGGLLTDNLSWRWVFYVNIPLGLLALVVVALVMPPFANPSRQHRVDYLGAAALMAAVVPLLIGFSLAGRDYAWGSPQVLGLFGLAAVMLALFLWVEARVPEPILPLSLFRNGIMVISTIVFFMMGVTFMSTIVYLPLFVQAVGGRTATESGLVLVPMMVATFVVGVIGGQLLSLWGRYKLLALWCVGATTLGLFLLSRQPADGSQWMLWTGTVAIGGGTGLGSGVFIVAMQNAFPQRIVGVVVGSGAFIRQLGSTVGLGVMGTLVSSRFITRFQSEVPPEAAEAMEAAQVTLPTNPQALLDEGTQGTIRGALEAGGVGDLAPEVLGLMRASLADGVNLAFLAVAVGMGLSLVACFFLKELPLRTTNARK
jgi:EmrB/QacA subfamily drug resistance transporter